MNMKLKWGTAARLRRGAVILGVVGLTAGAAVVTAGSALAANGSEPGNLHLNPASGATTLTPHQLGDGEDIGDREGDHRAPGRQPRHSGRYRTASRLCAR